MALQSEAKTTITVERFNNSDDETLVGIETGGEVTVKADECDGGMWMGCEVMWHLSLIHI